MTAVLTISLVLLAALLLNRGAGWLMRRFGIEPADRSARSEGFVDVLRRVEDWARERRDPDKPTR